MSALQDTGDLFHRCFLKRKILYYKGGYYAKVCGYVEI